jgi:4-amino-4-deoxy-L-arabinose transferase-like glycosyltransferase
LLSPEPWWEATAVHVLNGLLFVASMAAFELFLRELAESQDSKTEWALRLNSRAGRACAYALFLWCTLVLITVRVVTPDMLLSALVWLAAAIVLRIRRERATTATFVALGAILGAAYLTKSFMFPISLLILAVSWMGTRKNAASLRRHSLAAIAFIAIALPQVVALSSDGNGIRYSDSGWLAYALKVNRYPKMWVGGPPGSGTPAHPIVQLERRPATFSFATDSPDRTYPVWDEPAVWHRGMSPRFDLADQLAALQRNLKVTAGIALKVIIPLLVIVLLGRRSVPFRYRGIVFVAAAVIAAYLMLSAEGRLIGVWLVLLAIVTLAGTAIDETSRGKVARALVHALTLIGVISFATYVIDRVTSTTWNDGFRTPHFQWQVAEKVNALGVAPDSRVALVGDESDIYWARLSRVQVAVQIPLSEAPVYWSLSTGERDWYHRLLRQAGVKALVASWTTPPDSLHGWSKVEGTRFSVFPLNDTNDLEN